MRSPALAFAWEFGRRLRLGLMALAAYAVGVGTFRLLRLGSSASLGREASDELAAFVVVPLATTFMYFLAVFSFGFGSDIAARESMYPARMFTLPVSTRALAGWPMLFGMAGMMALLLLTTSLVRWQTGGNLAGFSLPPWGFDVPAIWPAVLAAVFLAWTQALTWMPYGLRGLRVIAAVLWLGTLDVVVFLAIHYEVQEPLMVAFLAPQIPLAYLAACFALTRARRGEVPDWGGSLRWGANPARDVRPGGRRFPSAERAQEWFEWRLHGWTLPALVAILLPFELGLLFLARNEPPAMTFYTLLGVLLTPPVMAGFVAAAVSRSMPSGRDVYGLPPFVATRPLTSTALITAKLKVTIGSTLAAWVLVLIAIPLGLAMSGTLPAVVERARDGIEFFGLPRAVAIMLLGTLGLVASTWKRLVHSLFLDLSGREWLIKSGVLLSLSVLVVIWPLGRWLHDDGDALEALLNALPWILAVLVCVKVSAAAWIATQLCDARLVSDRVLVTGTVAWLAAVLALYGVLAWFWNSPHIAGYFLLLIAILEIPLARLAAAPLALAWNRHR